MDMDEQNDIRWEQRYDNYHKACARLTEVTDSRVMASLSFLEKEGLIQRFEYTIELAWKVLQDLLLFKGYEFMTGPNGTLKMAFEDGLIANHDAWRRMMKARNMMSHTYNEEDADEVVAMIYHEFAALLKRLDEELKCLQHQ